MQRCNRKSAPQVVKGRVQKKNNRSLSTDYYDAPEPRPEPRTVIIDRKRPGDGYKHVLNKGDIYQFLEILPDWKNLAVGLNAIVLAPGDPGADGYHVPGVVHRQPPSEMEMANHFGVSPPSVHQMVVALENRRLIHRTPGQAQSIRVLVRPKELPDGESPEPVSRDVTRTPVQCVEHGSD